MAKIRCICNGSRGTDCDYCAGSGWITERINIGNTPPLNPPRQKPTVYRPVESLQGSTNKNKRRQKNSFDQRLVELRTAINTTQAKSLEGSIIYLRNKIKKLYSDIRKLEPKVTKRQRKHFNKICKHSIELIHLFDKKFEHFKLLGGT
jgi:hypothetical protein